MLCGACPRVHLREVDLRRRGGQARKESSTDDVSIRDRRREAQDMDSHANESQNLVFVVNHTNMRQALAYEHTKDWRDDDFHHGERADGPKRHRPPRTTRNLEPCKRRSQTNQTQRNTRGTNERRGVHDERQRRLTVGCVRYWRPRERQEQSFELWDQGDWEGHDHSYGRRRDPTSGERLQGAPEASCGCGFWCRGRGVEGEADFLAGGKVCVDLRDTVGMRDGMRG